MLTIYRMKSMLNPKFAVLFPHLPKTKTIPFISWASESRFRNHPTRMPNHFHQYSTPLLLCNLICSAQNRNLQMEASRPPSGETHVIVGPMFAGKTTALLRRIQLESNNGRSVALIKSRKDTRFGLDSIFTHDVVKLPCWALTDLSSFRQKFGLDAYEQLDVIGIDEAQFFEDLYDFCGEAADHDGKKVIVAGVDDNYSRKSFGSVLAIIPLADSVTKLTSQCEHCGKHAFFTLRKTQETQIELIGGADIYMPVCWHSAALCQWTGSHRSNKTCLGITEG